MPGASDNILLNPMVGGEAVRTNEYNGFHTQIVALSTEGDQDNQVAQYLCNVGDGSGTIEATGDYSVTPDIFFIQPDSNAYFRISQLIVWIQDATLPIGSYGNGSALANGLTIKKVNDDSTINDLLGGQTITRNEDWLTIADAWDGFSGGNQGLWVCIDFAKHGQYLRLDGPTAERLEITCSDDLSGLGRHTFFAKGFVEGSGS